MDPDQTAQMRIHAGRKPIMLGLSWRGSYGNAYFQIWTKPAIHHVKGILKSIFLNKL
jgi:hypothetical protein